MVDKSSELSDNDKNILLEQWCTCVEMADHISSRRDTMNSLFITINLSLITAISLIWQVKSLAMAVSGIVICILWHRLIGYYRSLNKSKYEVINSIEEMLPAQPFKDEWAIFEKTKSKEGTNLEKNLPRLFIVLYLVLSAVMICGWA